MAGDAAPLQAAAGQPSIRSAPAPRCPVCGEPGAPLYDELTDKLYGAPGRWRMRRCSGPGCRTLWLDPAPLEEDVGLAYQRYYTHGSEPVAAGVVRRLAARIGRFDLARRYGYTLPEPSFAQPLGRLTGLRPDLRALLDFQVMYLPARPGGRLLDVGCGDGEFIARMAGLGWSVEGLDFDPHAVEVARSRGLTVHLGGLAEQGYPDASFDAVVLSHLIEHVYRPAQLLGECARILKPGGLLSIVTPNAESFGHGRFGQDWRGLEPPRHLQVFTLGALTGLVGASGLRVRVARTSFRGANFLFLMSRELQAAPAPLRRTPALKLWAKLLQLREGLALARGRPVGEELVVVAER